MNPRDIAWSGSEKKIATARLRGLRSKAPWYQPQMATYTMRGHAWDHLDPAVPKFDKMPPR